MRPMEEIVVRDAVMDEADAADSVFEAVTPLLRSIYRPTAETIARQTDRARAGPRIIPECNGQVVGTVQFDLHEKDVQVIGLAVHPEFQRRGIARALLDRIAARMPALGLHVVVLDTIRETGNVAVFERLGFRVIHERITGDFESDLHSELHEVRMQRRV